MELGREGVLEELGRVVVVGLEDAGRVTVTVRVTVLLVGLELDGFAAGLVSVVEGLLVLEEGLVVEGVAGVEGLVDGAEGVAGLVAGVVAGLVEGVAGVEGVEGLLGDSRLGVALLFGSGLLIVEFVVEGVTPVLLGLAWGMVIWDDSPLTTLGREVDGELVVVPVCPEVPPVVE